MVWILQLELLLLPNTMDLSLGLDLRKRFLGARFDLRHHMLL
jgi:hypothetical protein